MQPSNQTLVQGITCWADLKWMIGEKRVEDTIKKKKKSEVCVKNIKKHVGILCPVTVLDKSCMTSVSPVIKVTLNAI